MGLSSILMGTFDNPKQIVARGYNGITQQYLELVGFMGLKVREKYLKVLFDSLPAGSRILELGCGAGVPMLQRLADDFNVVGLDISREQLVLAARNVPKAEFVLADMTRLCFTGATFDAAAAFYSITHVPRDEHLSLLKDIYRILKPSGLLMVTMGAGNLPDTVENDWLGIPMFFSHFNSDKNESLIIEAGFDIISATDEKEWEYDRPVCFHWIVACKPG